MVEEIKSVKDVIKNTLLNNTASFGDDDLGDRMVSRMARDLLNAVVSRAGKSKDDIIQILGREIGFALAAMLREPLEQLFDSKKLRISIELVGKDRPAEPRSKPSATKRKKRTGSKKRAT